MRGTHRVQPEWKKREQEIRAKLESESLQQENPGNDSDVEGTPPLEATPETKAPAGRRRSAKRALQRAHRSTSTSPATRRQKANLKGVLTRFRCKGQREPTEQLAHRSAGKGGRQTKGPRPGPSSVTKQSRWDGKARARKQKSRWDGETHKQAKKSRWDGKVTPATQKKSRWDGKENTTTAKKSRWDGEENATKAKKSRWDGKEGAKEESRWDGYYFQCMNCPDSWKWAVRLFKKWTPCKGCGCTEWEGPLRYLSDRAPAEPRTTTSTRSWRAAPPREAGAPAPWRQGAAESVTLRTAAVQALAQYVLEEVESSRR